MAGDTNRLCIKFTASFKKACIEMCGLSFSHFFIQLSPTIHICSISSFKAAVLFSQVANMTSMTNMSRAKGTKDMLFRILLAAIIAHLKDKEIA